MFEQLIREDDLYTILYGASAMLSLVACCYLLFRRANAIAPDITSPLRLRRWTAAFFASMTLSHVWYLPNLFLTTTEDILQSNAVGCMLDFMTLFPFAIVVLLSMLQDRRRPLWPVFVMFMPIVVGLVICCVNRSDALLPVLFAYYLLLCIGLIVYMVREVRQYGRWLCDNYADLEHKEMWQSFVVLAVVMLVLFLYTLEAIVPAYKYITQLDCIILVCFLVWRIETLSDLTIRFAPPEAELVDYRLSSTDADDNELLQTIHDKIGPLLQKHCIDTQLYLQHNLTLSQLAQAIGTNRFYLSQYFSNQGTTYNAYINELRINHFISLYHKAVDAHRSFTSQQLAEESGFRNYNTFSSAFKRKMGQPVTTWMKAHKSEKQT